MFFILLLAYVARQMSIKGGTLSKAVVTEEDGERAAERPSGGS
jgi:hypothetical protein